MYVKVSQKGKNRRGLSGAVTALILLIASILIVFIVIFFAFNYVSLFGGNANPPQITSGTISASGSYVTISITVKNPSTSDYQISQVVIGGQAYTPATATSFGAGISTVSFSISNANLASAISGDIGGQVTVTIDYANGQSSTASLLVTSS
ncbi:hypothetical protein HS7_00040 [Sulfolobales archaeon HS-7]|nr:hypothetical protein HS7_00040 [Sulfolobales archaeon HS-7]